MSKLEWDKTGEHLFETGVDKGVLYILNPNPTDESKPYDSAYAWNGLTAVNEAPSGAEATALYADNTKYLNLTSAEEFGMTIEAYTYPPQFEQCDGSATLIKGVTLGQQTRRTFGMSYRTNIGNDVDGNNHGYKIHIVYGCQAAPSSRDYSTINDSPEAITFSWEINTTPVPVGVAGADYKNVSSLTIDSTALTAPQLKAVEDALYGTDSAAAYLPLPAQLKTLIENAAG